ncbi:MAG: pyridoxal-phosphate dependent enzyme [Candidatus Eiseniibacteriota bacterium]|jgi:cystathionine beta-synthase
MITDDRQGLTYKRSILETIGNTPLIELARVARGVRPLVLAKVERTNPGGSVKDRIGERIIDRAEREGLLRPGGTIVEATSGNTGCGLAMVASVRGYSAVFTIPDKMSQEKVNLLKAYGAEVHVAPTNVAPDHPDSYYSVARRLAEERPGGFLANQYYNPANPESHYLTTGPEIWEQTGGQVDVFVAGIGTGGTISGVGKYLKEKNPAIQIVGADPVGSILSHYFRTGKMTEARPYKTEGVGEDIIPGTLDFSVIDRIESVPDAESLNMARRISREEGILVGGSCGLAAVVALRVAEELDERRLIVVLLPDTGERYLSKLYSDDWMRDNHLLDTQQVRVRDVLSGKSADVAQLVMVNENAAVEEALRLIRQHNISQVPVQRLGKLVGCIEEGAIMARVLEEPRVLGRPVGEVMGDPLPVIRAEHSADEVIRLLASRNAVVIEDDGNPVGILTRFDMIEYVAT